MTSRNSRMHDVQRSQNCPKCLLHQLEGLRSCVVALLLSALHISSCSHVLRLVPWCQRGWRQLSTSRTPRFSREKKVCQQLGVPSKSIQDWQRISPPQKIQHWTITVSLLAQLLYVTVWEPLLPHFLVFLSILSISEVPWEGRSSSSLGPQCDQSDGSHPKS